MFCNPSMYAEKLSAALLRQATRGPAPRRRPIHAPLLAQPRLGGAGGGGRRPPRPGTARSLQARILDKAAADMDGGEGARVRARRAPGRGRLP